MKPFQLSMLQHSLLALSAASILVACGGGTTGNTTTSDAGTTPPTTTSADLVPSTYTGPITGFGSVIVNGVRFSSTGAPVSDLDKAALSNLDLHIGTMVKVTGVSNDAAGTGTATSIVVTPSVRGSITAVSVSGFTVLGQTIVVDAKTAYENAKGLADLVVGNPVEVHGATQADGSILATLVEKKTFIGNVLEGVINTLDTTTKTFKLNNKLTVNYSTATVTGTLVNGAHVHIKSSTAPVAGVLTATDVAIDIETAKPTDVVKVAGIAIAAPINNLVTIGTTVVDVSKATYIGGTAIVAGSKVMVRGVLSKDVLLANQVVFDAPRDTQAAVKNELYGVVSSYTSISDFVVNGVTVDASSVKGLTLPLAVGTYLEITGSMTGNVLKASAVEVKKPTAPKGGFFETSGLISKFVSAASFVVNGMTVDASAATILGGKATDLADGRRVEMKGTKNDAGVFVVSKLQIQPLPPVKK